MRIWNYPLEALEEAVANAIYHRDYQVREPVEVRIYTDSIVILNYGGPDRSIKSDAFKIGPIKPRRYRNRRLGDFLKELDLTEGKATGIPRIKKVLKDNGSPDAFFDFDDGRTYFEVDFLIHPAYKDDDGLKEIKSVKQVIKNDSTFKLNDKSEKVISLIRNNPYCTASDLAITIGMTSRAIEKIIGNLKEAGLIERRGSSKS